MVKSDKVFYANMCFVCHVTVKEKELKRCSSCKLIYYCSEAHQKTHWKQHNSLCRVIQEIDLVLKPESFENNLDWYRYRTHLLLLSELKIERKLQPYEVKMILFPNNCQVCHTNSDLQPCLNCLCVNYCSEEHKKIDFESHKQTCNLYTLCFELDLYLGENHFYPDFSLRKDNLLLLDNIHNFIKGNVELKKNEAGDCTLERVLVSELLTCPLSLLFALTKINHKMQQNLVIHVVGCSFLETASIKSWETLLHINPEIQTLVIYFIGPEVQKNSKNVCESCQTKLKFKFYPDFYHDFFQRSSIEDPDIVCSFNCGFHEFENSETDTWNKTLPLLIQYKKVPLIFTSFTEEEAETDSKLLLQINKNLDIKILKNEFASLRPYQDLENLGIYFNNNYVGLVLNNR